MTVIKQPHIGVDIGTANIAMSREHQNSDGTVDRHTHGCRDCFISLPPEESTNLDVAGVDYVTSATGDALFVIGDDAVRLATALGHELRRPLARGFVSDKEEASKEVVTLILKTLLGTPMVENELVVYSVPGPPIDGTPAQAQYHTRFFADRLRELGYKPMPINEAMAVCYNELFEAAEKDTAKKKGAEVVNKDKPLLTGLCFSFGAGMINVALVYQSLLVRSFSLSMGGDFIDEHAAKVTNSTVAQVNLLKEEGIDLVGGGKEKRPENSIINRQPHHDTQSDRQAEAIGLMYRELLSKLAEHLNTFFADPANRVDIREYLPVIVSGGTSQAVGFLQLFDSIVLNNLDTRFALAKNAIASALPLDAVARGALRFAKLRTKITQ
jgi:actin-like ATPase involved in cell morphogenesis